MCSSIFWNGVTYSSIFWNGVTCSSILRNVVMCSSIFWDAVTCSSIFWNVVTCSSIFWNVVTCSSIFWAVMMCNLLIRLSRYLLNYKSVHSRRVIYLTKINLWMIEMNLCVKQSVNFKLTSESNVDSSWKGIIELLNWFLRLIWRHPAN